MLKNFSLIRRALMIAVPSLFICAVLAGAGFWHSTGTGRDKRAEGLRIFHARIRDGVGREVQFASPNDSHQNVRASVNSVTHFISKRSGTKISGETKNRLAAMEALVLSGEGRRLTIGELSAVLTETAVGRLSRLTDEEVAHIDSNLRGFDAPDLPEPHRRGRMFVRPRAGELWILTSEKVVAQIKTLRDLSANMVSREVVKYQARAFVEKDVKEKASRLSEVVPEKFGGIWDVANGREGDAGITPLQAFLITYSVASEDYLCDSESVLQSNMKYEHQVLAQAHGHYPSPDGHFAYGNNGYILSMPLDLVFDEQTTHRLLDLIEERSAAE